MTRRKIAAFIVSGIALVATPQVTAQNTGNTVFDECVIACLDAGGGAGGDGRMCRIICARELDSGNGNRQPPGPTPNPQPRMPGCRTADKQCAPNFPIPNPIRPL
jgi:hypothetical protein